MAHREIACSIVIDPQGLFLLQRRDDIAGILHPGKISLFGGHRERNETFLECAIRELHEELSYLIPPDRFEHLTNLDQLGQDDEAGTVRGTIFVVRDIPIDQLIITEGSLLIVSPKNLGKIDTELTPSTRFAIQAFLRRQGTPCVPLAKLSVAARLRPDRESVC